MSRKGLNSEMGCGFGLTVLEDVKGRGLLRFSGLGRTVGVGEIQGGQAVQALLLDFDFGIEQTCVPPPDDAAARDREPQKTGLLLSVMIGSEGLQKLCIRLILRFLHKPFV